uniref:TVP38/TMEM64 family protein n=1 Tax=Dubosiella newyorkensis TaxID=1862672 RepID=UPI002731181D
SLPKRVSTVPLCLSCFKRYKFFFPILPGGVSGSLAMLCFGTWKGFFYSYIGVLIGSSIAFLLVRKYGKRLLRHFVDQKTFDKYDQKLQDSKNFAKLFAIGIFLPIAPDDLLCMIAGLSSISFWKFFWIIVIGKPISSFFIAILSSRSWG